MLSSPLCRAYLVWQRCTWVFSTIHQSTPVPAPEKARPKRCKNVLGSILISEKPYSVTPEAIFREGNRKHNGLVFLRKPGHSLHSHWSINWDLLLSWKIMGAYHWIWILDRMLGRFFLASWMAPNPNSIHLGEIIFYK